MSHMTPLLETSTTAVSATMSAILGAQVFKGASHFLADTAQIPMPEWVQWLVGPVGALVGLVLALRWMAGRLNKAEEKIDRRENERDDDRKRLIEVLSENSRVISENSRVSAEVISILKNRP